MTIQEKGEQNFGFKEVYDEAYDEAYEEGVEELMTLITHVLEGETDGITEVKKIVSDKSYREMRLKKWREERK